MSFGQGINIKLYSGGKPWEEQFYSSTCDSMFVGGQHGGQGQTDCKYIDHENWGIQASKGQNDSVTNLGKGYIDDDFFNRWFKARPRDIRETGSQLTALGIMEGEIAGGLAGIAPGAVPQYWNTYSNAIGDWAQKATPLMASNYNGRGANGWDWALQSCRQEYGAYLNPDVKCDDPVCQMEKIAQTNPVYFESACDMDLHPSCVTDTVAKAVLVPIGEALVGVALTVATGGAGDAALIASEAAAMAAEDAGVEMTELAVEDLGENLGEDALDAGAEAGTKEGEDIGENLAERETRQLGRKEAEDGARQEAKDAEEEVEGNSCNNFKDGGIGRSAALVKKRATTLTRAMSYGEKKLANIEKDASFLSKAKQHALGIGAGAVTVAGISGVNYAIDKGETPYALSPEYQKSVGGAAGDIATTAQKAYSDAFGKAYKKCRDKAEEVLKVAGNPLDKKSASLTEQICRAQAMNDARKFMQDTKVIVGDTQAIGTDLQLAHQWAGAASLAKQVGGLHTLRSKGAISSAVKLDENPFAKGLKGGTLGGAAKQALACNWKSMLGDAVQITGAGLLAGSIAHEDCFTCTGNKVQEDENVAKNPFASGLGIKPEQPYGISGTTPRPLPQWSGDIVKPYCFIPNRRGAEAYCPIFGDTQKFENEWTNSTGETVPKNAVWPLSNSTDYQKYKGAILGTTDYEMPNNRPFWTLNDTQSRIQTGKQGLHHNIEGDTPPDVWNKSAALDPAVDEDPSNVVITDGGRKWVNYGYVCNYNHTDDFLMNPLQAQNFLDMTIGPIDTINLSLSGMMNKTCVNPLLFKDLQGLAGGYDSLARPETVYSKTGCFTADNDPIPLDPKGENKPFAEWSLNDKMKYYYSSEIMSRINVLGQGFESEHYRANIIPVPSDPNIPYNQNFAYTDGTRLGGDDAFALLPSKTPQYTGSLPWFQKGTKDHSFQDYQDTFNADSSNYKLPATFWYEHGTFNKIMADYCIRKGPRYGYPDGDENYDREVATSAQCMLKGGVESATVPGIPASPNAVRTYCPNMFLKSAGNFAKPPGSQGENATEAALRDSCYNCSLAELMAAGEDNMPRPTDICGRWYKGMIDSYKNLSNITKQNPTQIFDEYNKAVAEYCNVPSHRDLLECSCHNADNINNPTEFNHFFQIWSSFENTNMGTKGMKYCWLTPCVADLGGFFGFENEPYINFKDPAAYVNSFRQMPDSPWVGKCPEMACDEFLIYTDNTKLTDDHINTGINACGGDTLSNQGYICSTDNLGQKKCIASGRYISNTDPDYSQTEATCLKKCVAHGPSPPPCIEHYWICKDGELQKTYNKEYSQFWSGYNTGPGTSACDKVHPRNAPPGRTTAVIDVSSPSIFETESGRCQTEPYVPSKDTDQEGTYKEILLIIIVVMAALLMMLFTYLLVIKPYLHKKTRTSALSKPSGE